MRTIVLLLFGMFIAQYTVGQITFKDFGNVYPAGNMFFEDVGQLKKMETVNDETKQAIMLGFRNTDILSISQYISPMLRRQPMSK